jgi:hypothetical protein
MLPRVEVWQDRSGEWWWRYLERGADGQVVELIANRSFLRQEAATQAATSAYPETPIVDLRFVPARPRRAGRRTGRLLVPGGLGCLAAAFAVGLGLVMLAARRRRRPPRVELRALTRAGRG